jgi:small subunit ribosomal protein S9
LDTETGKHFFWLEQDSMEDENLDVPANESASAGDDNGSQPEASPRQESRAPQAELKIGSGASEAAGEEAAPEHAPTIRGKVDRFGHAMGTGRRKTSVARVRISEGSGKILINDRTTEDYFKLERDQRYVDAPLRATEMQGKVDIWVRVDGGGTTGQAGAVMLGIARALQALHEELHGVLSSGGFLTRDDRMVERKKYGYKKARKSFQFSKR